MRANRVQPISLLAGAMRCKSLYALEFTNTVRFFRRRPRRVAGSLARPSDDDNRKFARAKGDVMVALAQLWIPILASGVAVFVLSSLVHMVIKWHNSDYLAFANEGDVRAAIQKSNPAPGQYLLPHCSDPKLMQTPEFRQKFIDGPVGMVILRARGAPVMGRMLGLWFAYTVAVSLFAAYLGSRSLPAAADGIVVFRLVATVAFLAYAGGAVPNGIWMGKPWRSVAKELLDGLIYAAATGAAFACLWPH